MMNHYIFLLFTPYSYCIFLLFIALMSIVFLDYLDPVQQAPFDIDQDYVKMQTNEERIKVS